jgi:hypothetical protein
MRDHVTLRASDFEASARFYHPGYYGAFALDPDGNNVESVFHDGR